MRFTTEGQEGSKKYNDRVRLATLRHAIIGQLKSPPKGFEEVVLRHFSMCRRRILVQARRWMLESCKTKLYPAYERVYADLLSLLSGEALQKYRSLDPLPEDLKELEALEPSFAAAIPNNTEDQKQSAGLTTPDDDSLTNLFNPWLDPLAAQHSGGAARSETSDESDFDEIYQ